MQGKKPTDPLISLLGHALTSPSQELSDPVTVPEEKLVGGKRVIFQKTVRAAQQTGLSYTLQFPSSLWTPALDRARRLNGCETDFYALRTCLDADFEHAYIYPKGIMDPPSEVNDFITLEDDSVVQEQTTLHVTERVILWGLKASRVNDFTDATLAIGFNNPECIGCVDDVYVDAFAGGGDGTGAVQANKTADRFATTTAVTTGIAAGNVITGVYTEGKITLVSFADDADPATATTGGTAMSADGGLTFTQDTNITEPIHGVARAFGQYLAVGGTASGAMKVYVSDNGINWTALTSTALPATNAATAVTVDEATGAFYIVGEGGTLLKGTFSGGGIVLTALSANLPGTPGLLRAVAVVDEDRIIVGGASAYAAESIDGGASFASVSVPGTAAIRAIRGDAYRQIFAIGSKLQERSILTKNVFSEITVSDGVTITGNYTCLAMPPANGYSHNNYYLAGTDAGEIVYLKPRYPGA